MNEDLKTPNEKLEVIDQKIQALRDQKSKILKVQKEKERKERTRRLIQLGAITEKYQEGMTAEELKILIELGKVCRKYFKNLEPEKVDKFFENNVSKLKELYRMENESVRQISGFEKTGADGANKNMNNFSGKLANAEVSAEQRKSVSEIFGNMNSQQQA